MQHERHEHIEYVEIMLAVLEEDRLTDEYELPENMKRAMEMVLREELKREGG